MKSQHRPQFLSRDISTIAPILPLLTPQDSPQSSTTQLSSVVPNLPTAHSRASSPIFQPPSPQRRRQSSSRQVSSVLLNLPMLNPMSSPIFQLPSRQFIAIGDFAAGRFGTAPESYLWEIAEGAGDFELKDSCRGVSRGRLATTLGTWRLEDWRRNWRLSSW